MVREVLREMIKSGHECLADQTAFSDFLGGLSQVV